MTVLPPGRSGAASPRDATELALVRIYEDLLGVTPIGIYDCFFELGGHSILAVQLFAKIKQELGVSIPLTVLWEDQDGDEFKVTTVAYLRTLLETAQQQIERKGSIVLTRGTGGLPVFLAYAAGGDVLPLHGLTRALPQDRPCYALQAPPAQKNDQPEQSLAALAEHHCGHIKSLQPHGPYLLAGWSMGGTLAFEIAAQLQARGDEVGMLALLDSYTPRQFPVPQEAGILRDFLVQHDSIFGTLSSTGRAELETLPYADGVDSAIGAAIARGVLPASVELAYFRDRYEIYRAHLRAFARYEPSARVARMILIYAADAHPTLRERSAAEWQSLCTGTVERHEISGDHYSMLQASGAREVARCLASCLDGTGA